MDISNNISTKRNLCDNEGENLALRTFLMGYGAMSLDTIGDLRDHMEMSGWKDHPQFVIDGHRDSHVTKSGAQIWIRHLISLE